MADAGLVQRYLRLGLRLGRHVDGLVDAYYGPERIALEVGSEPVRAPGALADDARVLAGDLQAGEPLDDHTNTASGGDGGRRRWLSAQVQGLWTTARRLAGERVPYADEVEACYGVRPHLVPEDQLAGAHRQLDQVLPGTGDLRARYIEWREAHVVPADRLQGVLDSVLGELRQRTAQAFGLPDGERVELELVSGKPWSGFNSYAGNLHSVVAVNTDLPVLSTAVAHLVAHEAYPGHHTEHCRKEVGLVRQRRWWEESIFLVGTPQCLMAEGLADLGLEVVLGARPEPVVAGMLRGHGVRYDAEVVAAVAACSEILSAVRANAAWRLHAEQADPGAVVDDLARWGLLPRARAEKTMEFLLHPTWRSYVSCYVEGLPLCRRFVAGDPRRFGRLLDEQLTPQELADSAPAG